MSAPLAKLHIRTFTAEHPDTLTWSGVCTSTPKTWKWLAALAKSKYVIVVGETAAGGKLPLGPPADPAEEDPYPVDTTLPVVNWRIL